MKIKTSEKIPDNWDTMIASLGGGISHSGTHARYVVASRPNVTAQYLTLFSDQDDPIGAALGFLARSPRKLLAPFTGRFWLESIPVVRPDVENALLEFLRIIETYARNSGNAELEIGSSAGSLGSQELEKLGFDLIKRFEFELDLEKSQEELWKGMEHKRRKNINKAIRSEVIIQDLPAEQGISELRRLQGHSSRRIVARGGRDITHEHQLNRDPLMILLESGLGRIVGARINEEIVSAGLFTYFNGLVYHTLSGHSNVALKCQAPTLLIWETIKRYQEEGAKRFNFGGCKIDAVNEGDSEHGIYVYKKAFGTECVECTSGYKILKKTTHALVSRLKSLRKK